MQPTTLPSYYLDSPAHPRAKCAASPQYSLNVMLQLMATRIDAGFSHRVTPRRHNSSMPGPVRVEELAARFVEALVGVRAEIIPLRLEQVGRQTLAAVSV